MNRLVGLPDLAAVAAVAAALALGTGCTDTNYQIYITKNQPITEGCTIPNGTGDIFVGFGTLDVSDPIPGTQLLNPGYILAAAVRNGTAGVSGDANLHIFFSEGADVELRSNGASASSALIAALNANDLAKRTQYFSGSIPPGGTAGFAIAVIDSEQTAAIGQVVGNTPVQVISRSRMFGKLDGSEIQADPFDYPVTVCKGCLVQNVGLCSAITKDDPRTFNVGGTCNKVQDANLDCCTDDAGRNICPPVKPAN